MQGRGWGGVVVMNDGNKSSEDGKRWTPSTVGRVSLGKKEDHLFLTQVGRGRSEVKL